MKFILFVLIFVIVFSAYAIIENCFLLVKRRVNLGGNVKILQISDCHKRNNRKYNRRIIDIVKGEIPDAIFITGDFVSRYNPDFPTAEAFLNELCGFAPVYMCMGNHEQKFVNARQEDFLDAVGRTKAKMLINSGEYAEINGRKYYICGLMPKYTTYKKDDGYRNLDVLTQADMTTLLGQCPAETTLLLAHNPLFADIYANWGADYTFSGHVHGGVVRLFGVGILSPERKFFPKYSKGIYHISGKKVLVSAGIGKLRLFNPPEIVVYNID